MIQINNLQKSFGNLEALKNVNLNINKGQITYIVGPNGSGKTTLIKSLLGLVRPDSGDILIDGVKLNGECGYKSQIGYMPQTASFPENLRVNEVFDMIQNLRGYKGETDEQLFKNLEIEKEKSKRLGNLSGGTKQKVSAALAFLFNPQILILDEPTAGLDPVASSLLKDKIKYARDCGRTVILTSHIISELEELAENIVFIIEGNIKFSGKLKHLIESTNKPNLERAVASLMNGF